MEGTSPPPPIRDTVASLNPGGAQRHAEEVGIAEPRTAGGAAASGRTPDTLTAAPLLLMASVCHFKALRNGPFGLPGVVLSTETLRNSKQGSLPPGVVEVRSGVGGVNSVAHRLVFHVGGRRENLGWKQMWEHEANRGGWWLVLRVC